MKYLLTGLIALIAFSFCANAQRPGTPKQFHFNKPEPKRNGIKVHRTTMRIRRHNRIKKELNYAEEQKRNNDIDSIYSKPPVKNKL